MSAAFAAVLDFHAAVDLAAAWDKAPEMVEHELVAVATQGSQLLERETRERTPTGAIHALKAGISAREPIRLSDQVIGIVGTSIAYAVPVELGTKPHFPPVKPLEDWVKAKLGVPDADAHRVAFLVARKIAREGTKGAHMFQRAFDANRAQIARMFEAAMGRIRQGLIASGAR